jgi:amino acid transporter
VSSVPPDHDRDAGAQTVAEGGHGAPSPSDQLTPLDAGQLSALRQIGEEWRRVCGNHERWHRALPVDPQLSRYPSEVAARGLGRFVPVALEDGGPAAVEASADADTLPTSALGRVAHRLRRVVLGPPLKSTAIAVERMRKLVALPVLSADALSSVAYGPEAMLAILVLAGSAGLRWSFPIAGAIAFLMLAVGVSYRQTIRAYPHGGGSYIVATDNLGRVPGLVAAAGLMTDYILTVAVSIAAGVAAITSAIPSLSSDIVVIGIGVIVVLLAANLRGVRQAGALFAWPTYAFIAAIFVLVAVGLGQAAGRGFQATPTPALQATEGLGLLLVLRAFSSGSTAMTGIEAISNAVPVFKPPEWRNARTTLSWMIVVLIAMFAGIVVITHLDGIVPTSNETVLSQLAHRDFGGGVLYGFTQAATALVLLLAANTAYNDFPRVLFLLARDFQAPRIFLRLGDRLAFNNGIILLSIAAAIIYAAFGGKTNPLIPLYAVGVFLAFTLSQAGMVVHWWRGRDAHWRKSMAINAVGCGLSAIVFLIAGLTKFTQGAWAALVVIGLFIFAAERIRRHYDLVRKAVALRPQGVELPGAAIAPPPVDRGASAPDAAVETEETPERFHNLMIVALASLDLAGLRALAYATSLQQPVLALHVSPAEDEAERFRTYWQTWGDHLPLEIVVSPYRAIVAPMINYIEMLHWQSPDLTLTVIVPELVVRHWWHSLLHNGIAPRLRRALRPLPKIVVTTVPFHLPD